MKSRKRREPTKFNITEIVVETTKEEREQRIRQAVAAMIKIHNQAKSKASSE